MTSQKPEITVEVTVAGHELWKGKPATKLDIPSWNSQYPLVLYGISPEDQGVLPIGQALTVVLTQDNQKNDTDGLKPWHYFWSFARLATTADVPRPWSASAPAGAPAPALAPASAAPAGMSYEANAEVKDVAIRRAVALKAAVELTAHRDISKEKVLEIADSFVEWLAAPTTPAEAEPKAKPVAQSGSQAGPAAPPAAMAMVEEAPTDSDQAFDALPSAAEKYRAQARAILTKLDALGPDYAVTETLFGAMTAEMMVDTAAIKKALGDKTPLAWIRENKDGSYREVVKMVCGAVISGA